MRKPARYWVDLAGQQKNWYQRWPVLRINLSCLHHEEGGSTDRDKRRRQKQHCHEGDNFHGGAVAPGYTGEFDGSVSVTLRHVIAALESGGGVSLMVSMVMDALPGSLTKAIRL